MKVKLLLIVTIVFFVYACQKHSENEASQFESVKVDSVYISDLQRIVPMESGLLAEPREISVMDEENFAVYDHGFKRVMVFNTSGDKQYEFGSIGSGPGEWDEMTGVASLNFYNDQFLTANQGRFLFDRYDRNGRYLNSITYPRYMNYTDKTLLADNRLLVTTNGHEKALAVVLDLDSEGAIIQRIGSPEIEPAGVRNHEQERIAYANGQIPEQAKNNALAARGSDGYYLFMNTLGELRYYPNNGEPKWKENLPEAVTEPVFNYIVQQNREVARPHTVLPLKFALKMQIIDNMIYLFMPKLHPDINNMDVQLLAYDIEGNLKRHIVFPDSENEYFLYNAVISEGKKLYTIDIMNAQVFVYDLN